MERRRPAGWRGGILPPLIPPDDYWGVRNLAGDLSDLGRKSEAISYLIARADLRPNDLSSNFEAWEALRRLGRDDPAARRLKFRMLSLASSESVRQGSPGQWSQLQLVPAQEYW